MFILLFVLVYFMNESKPIESVDDPNSIKLKLPNAEKYHNAVLDTLKIFADKW